MAFLYTDLLSLCTTPITSPLPEEIWKSAIHASPFLPLPTLLNTRSLSLLPNSRITPHRLLRSGTLHLTSEADMVALRDSYGLVKIFDLRREVERQVDAYTVSVPGITLDWVGQTITEPQKMDLNRLDKNLVEEYMWIYRDILDVYKPGFESTFAYLRDTPEGGILFHCNGGKDRTGVLSALLLNLSGHSPELIAQDYALTRIGTEAQREFLTNRLHDWLGPDAMDKPGVFELSSCDAIVMLAFVDWLDKEYGGAEGWLKKECKWTGDDIEKVRKNIMVQ